MHLNSIEHGWSFLDRFCWKIWNIGVGQCFEHLMVTAIHLIHLQLNKAPIKSRFLQVSGDTSASNALGLELKSKKYSLLLI
jgi:hypothetical protein